MHIAIEMIQNKIVRMHCEMLILERTGLDTHTILARWGAVLRPRWGGLRGSIVGMCRGHHRLFVTINAQYRIWLRARRHNVAMYRNCVDVTRINLNQMGSHPW
eukprot:COSAG02_NODE_8844_length_2422_cov_256.492467_4_plen_103_part_00